MICVCVLCFVLCFVFCILCFVFCVLCFVFCVLCFVFVICVLCFVFCVLFCVLCFVFCVLCFVFCILCFVFCVLCFVFWVLSLIFCCLCLVPHVPLPQLTKTRVLHKRWKEILVNPACKKDDAEFPSLHRELKQLSDAIGWGLADLAETIWIVESNRSNFLLGDDELASRKRFVEDAKSEIEEMKKGFQDPAARALMKKFDKAGLFSGSVDPQSRLDREIEMDNENFIQQQLTHTRELEEEQEVHIESILRSVNTIEQVPFLPPPPHISFPLPPLCLSNFSQIGNEMNDELERHNVMLENLSEMADNTGTRIRKTMKDIDKFIDESNNTVSYTMIFVLVLIVLGLFVLIVEL